MVVHGSDEGGRLRTTEGRGGGRTSELRSVQEEEWGKREGGTHEDRPTKGGRGGGGSCYPPFRGRVFLCKRVADRCLPGSLLLSLARHPLRVGLEKKGGKEGRGERFIKSRRIAPPPPHVAQYPPPSLFRLPFFPPSTLRLCLAGY